MEKKKETKGIARVKNKGRNKKLDESGRTKVVMYRKGEYNSWKISPRIPYHLPSILSTPSAAQEKYKGSILPEVSFFFLVSVLYLIFPFGGASYLN